jgi:methylated-DNA-[protein]-cysteine S-methyltransferase
VNGSPIRISVFDTTLGPVGIGYDDSAVIAVQLPEATEGATRSRLRRSVARHPQGAVVEEELRKPALDAAVRIQALLAGEAADLDPIPVDLSSCPPFHQRIYEMVRTIAPGQVMTYGEVAEAIGQPGAAQAVGKAMGSNPVPIIVPCHRVVGADGKLVGFSASGGVETKRRMLLIEGSTFVAPSLFD